MTAESGSGDRRRWRRRASDEIRIFGYLLRILGRKRGVDTGRYPKIPKDADSTVGAAAPPAPIAAPGRERHVYPNRVPIAPVATA